VMVNLQQPLPMHATNRRRLTPTLIPRDVQVRVNVDTEDGFHDEEAIHLTPRSDNGSVKVKIVEPRRWWPASMGDQPLYKLSVGLMVDGEETDTWSGTLGLTSVRRWKYQGEPVITVNGLECNIGAVVPVDLVHERHLLPVTGDSLMIVRGHWGSDVLYEAADRGGVLLIQTVPLDVGARPEETIVEQVNRLSRHPSLAGWYVGNLGRYTERMAYLIECLDPTRPVFKQIPEVHDPAAA
jgi:beta-galactosidase/beta-glucuronidase